MGSYGSECCSQDIGRRPFKIDIHTHIMPSTLPDLGSLSEASGDRDWPQLKPNPKDDRKVDMFVGETFFRTVEPNCFDPQTRLDEMAASGVHVQVLSPVPVLFCYEKPIRPATRFVQYLNEDLAQVCRQHPNKFIGLGTLPLQDVDASIRELHRCKYELGLVGVEIGTEVNGLFLDDPIFEPLWQACEDLDMPLFVHPLGYSLPKENKNRWERYWSSWLVGMPCETALCLHALTCAGVFVKFPELRMCFAHAGGAWPALIGRIQHGYDCRPDLVALDAAGTTPTQHLCEKQNIWIDSLVHDPDLLEYLVKKVGHERIVMGSDYPFPLGEVPEAGRMLSSDKSLARFLSNEQRSDMLATNTLRFLGLDNDPKWQHMISRDSYHRLNAPNVITKKPGKISETAPRKLSDAQQSSQQ